MSSMELFALGLLVVCSLGLGLSVVVEAGKLLLASAHRSHVAGRLESRNAALAALVEQLESLEDAANFRETELNRLNGDIARVEGLIRSVQADKIEMAHEIGSPDGTNGLFICDLKTTPDFSRLDGRRLVFAREIWGHRNVAHIWADTVEDALSQAQRAFTGRAGVVPGRIRPHGDDVRHAPSFGTTADARRAPGPVPRRPSTEHQPGAPMARSEAA